eukprot:TRINITY_DN34252_c0_g1_i1.p1 TRINITY_DN34252_c0_g1~~TRINITY_DN34252_c0_g1_i1.p1  ORF type:complete len:764 (-),score=93.26 TRINITY_DN34252_c0_g1_i1:26-2317(-)
MSLRGTETETVHAPMPTASNQTSPEQQGQAIARNLVNEIGEGLRICVLGGTSIQSQDTAELLEAISARLFAELGKDAWFLTEGMPGVQHVFARHCGDGSRLCNVLPARQKCNYGRGRDVTAGDNGAERKRIFSTVGDVYLILEGGPGAASQARQAFAGGARLVPVIRTGGASAGLFDFPADALRRPTFATKAQWAALGARDGSIASCAEAVVELVAAAARTPPGQVPASPESTEVFSDSEDSPSKPLLGRAKSQEVEIAQNQVASSSCVPGDRSEPSAAPLSAIQARSEARFANLSQELHLPAAKPGIAVEDHPAHPSQVPFQTALPPPVPRALAGPQRLQARDEWNVQEILLDWTISASHGQRVRERHGLPPPPVGEAEFVDLFDSAFPFLEVELWPSAEPWQAMEAQDGGLATAEQERKCAYRSADRDRDGCMSAQEVHHGLRSLHGHLSLTKSMMRLLASTDLLGAHADDEDLHALMKELNGGLPVSRTEVAVVRTESELVTELGSLPGRPEMLWGLGAWYVNVARRDSTWRELFRAGIGRWIPADEEHHGWVLHQMARVSAKLPKTLSLPKRLGRGHPAHAKDSETSAAGAGLACTLLAAVLMHIFFLVILLFPIGFFSILLYLGSEHGDDQCPRDLDGLLVWFGAMGLAVLMVDCASEVSFVAASLKTAVGLTPWLGVWWLFGLQEGDAARCGPFVFHTSRWVWASLCIGELYLVCVLVWSCHVARNHELALRRAACSEHDALNRPDSGDTASGAGFS